MTDRGKGLLGAVLFGVFAWFAIVEIALWVLS